MTSPLQVPRLRAAARRVKAGGERFLGGVLPGASARRLQIKAFADDWAAANLEARQATGPLWVVLGDSASQGIGATRRETGYVGVVHERLRHREAWRVINLSRAGAGVADVLTRQLPELIALTNEESAALVSCLVGAEDISRRVPGLDVTLRQMLAALPPGTVVGTFARGARGGPAAALDAIIREEAERHRLRVAELPPRFGPGARGRGANLLGDVEHAGWAEAVIAAIDGPPAEIAPSTDPELPVVPALDAEPVADAEQADEIAPTTDPELPVVPAVDAEPAVDAVVEAKTDDDAEPVADAEPAVDAKLVARAEQADD
jgi:lysophospholipase L1-like esterase